MIKEDIKTEQGIEQNPCYKHTTKVMLSNEIRIGNLLSYNNSLDSIGEVTEIKKSLIIGMDKVRFGYRTDKLHKFNDCKPVPLTEEWLLKFGFRSEENYCFELDNIAINTKRELMWIHTKCKNNVELNLPEFVHQLQNLYFALTQTELHAN